MLFTLSLLLVVCGVVLVHHWLHRRGLRWRQLSQFPGDYPLPLIGNALQLGFDVDESSHRLMQIWKRLGKRNFRMTVGSEEWVILCDPEDIGVILNHPSELAKSPERNAAMKPFFGDSLSSSEGNRWKWTRKLMAPSFQYKTLENRIDAVNKHCGYLVEALNAYEGRPVDLYRYLRPFMFDILCDTLMGVDHQLIDDPDHPYLIASGKVIEIVTKNYFSYWRNIHVLFSLTSSYQEMMTSIKTIRDYSDKIIKDRRQILKKIAVDTETNNKYNAIDIKELINNKISENNCLLDSLMLEKLPNGNTATDEMINEEISLVCFTGHYTTTMTISHTLYCLAKYPEIQKRVIQEQQSIFKKDMLRNPTNRDLSEMKYLEVVIKESMRVIPTVTKIGRQLKEDIKLKDNRIIPAGTTVIVYYQALFENDRVFPEPHKYDPDRFLENMHGYAFVPFSAGPRNCIGFRYAWVAMKATLSNILRRFEVFEGGPGTEPQFAHRIITESTNGMQLKLKKRAY